MNNDVIKIEEFIWSKIEKENRIGLLNGLSGIGILYKYLTELDSQKYSDKLTYINTVLNKKQIYFMHI